MSHGQGLRQFVQRAAAHRAVRALGAAILLVALSVHRVKERQACCDHYCLHTGHPYGHRDTMKKIKKAQGEKNSILFNDNGHQHLT